MKLGPVPSATQRFNQLNGRNPLSRAGLSQCSLGRELGSFRVGDLQIAGRPFFITQTGHASGAA